MSSPSGQSSDLVESKDQLVSYIESACKPAANWRIGTEHEKFAYNTETHQRLPYEGTPGIRAVLEGLLQFGWQGVYENGKIIALLDGKGGSVSLEPGGQFELSGAPLSTIHETCSEVHTHLHQVKQVCEPMNADMVGLGFDPEWRREDITWMPKGRYKIMRDYMPTRGSHGIDMMIRTCTVQVNLDFGSERDMVRKMRVSVALQPIATALFANSPFTEGKPNGYLSMRSACWADTDPDRCGMLPFVFDTDFGFERWVDYILDVPMYFVHRGDTYHNVAGKSFRDFMLGKLEGFEGQLPTMGDWEDHMTTAFPEVRLKKYIEMRGADAGPWGNLCALPAFWVGLLYDETALDEAEALIEGWSVEEMSVLRDAVPRGALDVPFRNGTAMDVARKAVEISRNGLKRRARISPKSGLDEQQYIEPLESIVASGKTFAQDLLEDYETRWDRNIYPIYDACRY